MELGSKKGHGAEQSGFQGCCAEHEKNSDAKQPDSWDGWGSSQADDSSTDEWKTSASGNNKGWKSDGSDAKENRRDHRGNPGRLPMRPVERPPRPRYELPAGAKKALQEIEPIVTMVRKIFCKSSDGVRLSLEDERFVIEKVLEHHPEKEKKVPGEIDHIVVNKHHVFQKSRCFYVVSSDGAHTDFSYNKCMDNYVRKNYAEHAELICGMRYFKKCNHDRPAAVDGGAAPATEAKASQSMNPGNDTLPDPLAGIGASLTFKKCNHDRPAAVDGGAAPATEAKASQSMNPGDDTLPDPPAGIGASLTVTTNQGETLASPAATPEDKLN